MINLKYTKNFTKNYRKRIISNSKLDRQFQTRLHLFLQNTQNPQLRDHKLTGTKKHLRAFSVSGDIRVLYEIKGNDIYLMDIGSHNQVY